MAARYTVDATADIALSAATAKTILSVINAANSLVRVIEFGVSFDSVTSNAEPVTVELGFNTEATAGTATSHTIVQSGGPTRTVQATAKRNFTVEPTVITVFKRWLVHPQSGLVIQFPLGREPEQTTSARSVIIRCTAPAAVNVQGYIEFEEG